MKSAEYQVSCQRGLNCHLCSLGVPNLSNDCSLPAPPAEFDEVRPRSGKARRARRRKEAAVAGADDNADVVVLDPNRRRTAQ